MIKRFLSVIKDTLQQMRDGELQLVAASLAFSTAIALIPFLAVVLATFQSIGGLEVLYPKVESFLLRNLREAGGSSEVTKVIRSFLRNISAGKMGSLGAIFLFLTSLRLMHDMEVGIHRVWNQKNTRPFYKRLIYQWGIILIIPVALAVYIGFSTLEQFRFVHRVIPASISNSLLLVGCLFLTYKYVPATAVRNRAAFISSVLASCVVYAVHLVYTTMVVNFFNYNKIYGSFAAIPLLLLWILTMWYVILGGVALCASLQKRHVA